MQERESPGMKENFLFNQTISFSVTPKEKARLATGFRVVLLQLYSQHAVPESVSGKHVISPFFWTNSP
jgi:hypothetical protein